jgi:hypothetical protein
MPAASTLTTDATRQLTSLRSQQARLIDAYQAGVISLRDLEARRRPVTDRIGELEQLARHAEHHRLSQAELKQRIDDFASEVADGLAAMDFARRQQLVRTVLDKVVLSESRIGILFKIPLPARQRRDEVPTAKWADCVQSAKTAQKHDYPSAQWRRSYRRRTSAERASATIKDTASNNIARGWCRLTGLTAITLWIACLLAVRNQRILDSYQARQHDDARRAAAGLPPRTRKRRRTTLAALAAGP